MPIPFCPFLSCKIIHYKGMYLNSRYNISQICDAIPLGMIGWRIFIYLAASNQHYYGKMIIRNSFSLGIASEVRISQRIKKYKISFCCSLKTNRRTTTTRMTISQGVRVEWLWLGYKKFSVWVIRKKEFFFLRFLFSNSFQKSWDKLENKLVWILGIDKNYFMTKYDE